MTSDINRRSFIRNVSAAGVGLGVAAASGRRSAGSDALNNITLAILGTNSRGSSLAKYLRELDGYEIAYVCDPEDGARAKGLRTVEDGGRKTPKAVRDFRKALEDPVLDAVLVATPDHWHAPAALMALDAGKHVYVEKPCSHNPREGELLVEAAAKHKDLTVAMGVQRRSFPLHLEAITAVHSGAIGRAYLAKAWYANSRSPIGKGKDTAPPSTLDWDLWQGPAPRTSFRDNLVHYNWHWRWNWGTGETCNNGTHELDVCRWALDVDYPVKVTSAGGRFHYDDDWEPCDTQQLGFEFADKKIITWEGKSCNPLPTLGQSRGVVICGTEGSMVLLDDSYSILDMKNQLARKVTADEVDRGNSAVDSATAAVHHLHNFLSCIRNGNTPNADILNGHQSVLLCHLGNIAQRTGGALTCDPKSGRILKNEHAQRLWSREYEPGWMPTV